MRRVSQLPKLDPAKDRVDGETVRAVVRNRLYILARFARTVTLPVLREELRRADASCPKFSSALDADAGWCESPSWGMPEVARI